MMRGLQNLEKDIKNILMENKNELVSAMTLIATNSKYVKCISNNAIKIREQLAAPNICQRWLQLL